MSFGEIENKHYEAWLEKTPSLEGKVVAITGTTSGTGYWAAVFAVRKGAKALFLLNRDSQRSKDALKKLEAEKEQASSNTELIPVACDLMSFASVRSAADEINAKCAELGGLNVLGNNAGIMGFPDNRTEDGYEVQVQTNHLSHFLLAKLVFPSFQMCYDAGAEVRIVQHSSQARNLFAGDLEEKFFSKSKPNTLGGNGIRRKMARYHYSKLANTCFAMMLHKKLQEQGYDVSRIKSAVAEPGAAGTSLGTNLIDAGSSRIFKMMASAFVNLFQLFASYQSAADGALPFIEACFGEDVKGGDFFHPEKVSTGKPLKVISEGKLLKQAKSKEKTTLNEKNHEVLWKVSEDACGPFFEN